MTTISKYVMEDGTQTIVHCHDDKTSFDSLRTKRILKYGGDINFGPGCTDDQKFSIYAEMLMDMKNENVNNFVENYNDKVDKLKRGNIL